MTQRPPDFEPLASSDLATRIAKAQERYATAGQALSQCAGPMYTYQQSAYAAVWKAKDAAQTMLKQRAGPAATDEQSATHG